MVKGRLLRNTHLNQEFQFAGANMKCTVPNFVGAVVCNSSNFVGATALLLHFLTHPPVKNRPQQTTNLDGAQRNIFVRKLKISERKKNILKAVKVGFFQKVMAKFSNLSDCHSCEPKIVLVLLIPVYNKKHNTGNSLNCGSYKISSL